MRTIRHGSRGPSVVVAQERLQAWGWALPRFGADGHFGDETEGAVVEFQGSQGLLPDGVIGPDTWPRLLSQPVRPPALLPLAEGSKRWLDQLRAELPKGGRLSSLEWALSQLGIHEEPDGSNAGPELDPMYEYLQAGFPDPVDLSIPWCAVFVSWCLDAGNLHPHRPFVASWRFERLARSTGRWLAPAELLAGDVVVMPRKASGSDPSGRPGAPATAAEVVYPYPGHCALVLGQNGAALDCLGGNVGNAAAFQLLRHDRVRGGYRPW